MISLNNTTHKLKEAEFFLDKLEPHRPYFDFYLSAFLNASRSTTWIMRNEFNDNPNWRKWFENATVEKITNKTDINIRLFDKENIKIPPKPKNNRN